MLSSTLAITPYVHPYQSVYWADRVTKGEAEGLREGVRNGCLGIRSDTLWREVGRVLSITPEGLPLSVRLELWHTYPGSSLQLLPVWDAEHIAVRYKLKAWSLVEVPGEHPLMPFLVVPVR